MPNTAPTPESLFQLGNTQLAAKHYAAAELSYRQALDIDPLRGEVLANLAYVKEQQAEYDQACEYYRLALRVLPDHLQIHLNYGALLTRMKAFTDAEMLYKTILKRMPDSAAAWSNLGIVLACSGREAEAEQAYRHALQLAPDYDKASFNLSYLLLRQERYQEGWEKLEARPWLAALDPLFSFPRWRGEALSGCHVLIVFEGGFGDMIQFCRYTTLLRERGAQRIGILCHPPLRRLLASLAEVDCLFGYDEDLPDQDWTYWVGILSLPHYCGTNAASIPASIPYLFASEELRQIWRHRLPQEKKRIGIAWQGNPQFENDQDRSIRQLENLLPLLQKTGFQWISLQKGSAAAQAHAWTASPLLCADQDIHDFADTAALISELDLVISVDTAIAHLAGALGKPCFLMLPYYRQDWRWLKDRTDTPWYPTLQIFRQAQDGDWLSLIAAIASALDSRFPVDA